MEKSCCFFGHRDISEAIKPRLTEAITKLTDEIGIEDFYVGNQGGFDSLVLSVLKELAISNPKLRYSIVLAYLPTDHSAVCDENTLYPEGMENVPKRYCIARRNDWMIEHSKYVICYVKHITGGATQIMKKAQRKNRIVINLA